MSNQKVVQLGRVVRDKDNRFDSGDSIDSVVETLLNERLSQLEEEGQKAEEKQSELRQKMGVGSDDGEAEELSEAEQKRAELRERF